MCRSGEDAVGTIAAGQAPPHGAAMCRSGEDAVGTIAAGQGRPVGLDPVKDQPRHPGTHALERPMFDRLVEVQARFDEINGLLITPEVTSDHRKMTELAKEQSKIEPVVAVYGVWKKAQADLEEAREMLDDPEMREMAREEIDLLEAQTTDLEEQLKMLLLPKDPYEGRNVILEIRAGTGGDEAALFVGDLFRMYNYYCEQNKFKFEVFSAHEISVGGGGGRSACGYKEILCKISGDSAYTHLAYEGGTHRVQRVPLTETQGRVHTSAATVAVLPEADAVEIDIATSDLRIDVMRAGGPGGQSVNTTDSAVRIVHIPTNITVICQDEKSQHKNKARAMSVLSARLLQKKQEEAMAEETAARRSMVGSGDRSEKIRTYNYPQNRITDHRINLTLYKLDRMMDGDLTELITALQAHQQAKLLAAQEQG
jgi:peptide chain release factor 1